MPSSEITFIKVFIPFYKLIFPFYPLSFFFSFLSSSWIFLTLVHHISVYDFVGLPAHSWDLLLQCCTMTWPEQSTCLNLCKIRRLIGCIIYPAGTVFLEPGLHTGTSFALHTSSSWKYPMACSLTVKTAQQIKAIIAIFFVYFIF